MTRPIKLLDVLSERIQREGPLTLHDYMSTALTHPELGYYVAGEPIGRDGDFITAPEVSQMFGEMVGLWAAQVWLDMGRPAPFLLVELGPGQGTLMSDILRSAGQAVPDFLKAADVHLVEVSPLLRVKQSAALKGFSPHGLSWCKSIEDVPKGQMILVANEFLDALPIHQYVRSHDGWHERLVAEGVGGPGTLGFCLAGETTDLDLPKGGEEALVESIFERRPGADVLGRLLAERLGKEMGAALFTDYGHRSSSIGDTFQAVMDHKPIHVLAHPGEADLTAHVDFEAFARSAAGLGVTKVQEQRYFLEQLGIAHRLTSLSQNATPEQSEDLKSSYERLMAPEQMGSLFKAICLYSPDLPVPPGFTEMDGGAS